MFVCWRFSKRPRRANGKFSPAFFKRRRIPKAEHLDASRRTRNTFSFKRIRRGAPTFRWTVGAWGTLSRGSPMGRGAAHFFFVPPFILLSRLILTQQNCATYSFALLPRGHPLFRAWKSGQKAQWRGCFDSPPPYTSPATT